MRPLTACGLLQAYSQDAYLKGNEAYSGNAQNIPEPPPICYPRIEIKAVATADSSEPAALAPGPGRRGGAPEKSYRVEIPVPPPLDPVDRGSRVARAGPSHRTEENRHGPPADLGSARPRPLIPSVPGGAQLQHPSSSSSRPADPPVYSPSSGTRPSPVHPETSSPPAAAATASPDTFSPAANHYSPPPTAPSSSPHQNIDWRTYTTYKDYIDAKRLHAYGCRTIQERLDSLRAASSAYTPRRTPPPPASSQRGAAGSQVRRRSASNDRGAEGGETAAISPLRSASQERLGGGADGATATRNWPRSASQDALPFSNPTGGVKPRARSCDYLGQQPGVCGGRTRLEDGVLLCQGEEARASRQGAGGRAAPPPSRSPAAQEEDARRGGGVSSPPATDSSPRLDGPMVRPSRLPVKNAVSDPSAAFTDQRAKLPTNHLGYPSPRGRADSLKMDSRSESGLGVRTSSCSAAPSRPPPSSSASCAANGAVTLKPKVADGPGPPIRSNGGLPEGVEGPDATVVILRRDKTSGGPHVRPPSYVLAVNDRAAAHAAPPLVKAESADRVMCWTSSDSWREKHLRRLKSGSDALDDSLDSIPFIGKTAASAFRLPWQRRCHQRRTGTRDVLCELSWGLRSPSADRSSCH